ncbi:MAG: hypothetical protein KDA60_08675, partial [Planctomycetales bacterium]|nr:hypothetical protein [Planctomycetales bacterium]
RVRQVNRDQQGVTLSFDDRPAQRFDHVVLATHADRTLQLLQSPTPLEQHLLACFPYQENHAVLHTDRSLLPRRRAAWASWNYHRPAESTDNVSVTYDLNRLQGLNLPGPLCLTLNPTQSIDPAHQIMDFDFAHPVFSLQSVVAQRRWAEISGPKQTHFCGAYWGYGFHEDGANSGIAVARALGIDVETVLGRSSDIAIDPRRHKPVVVHPHAPALQRTRPRSVSSSSILPAQLKER